MADAVTTSEIRVNADTRNAQMQVGRLQGAMSSLKQRGVAPLGAGLASLTGTAARMSGASMGMSAGITAAAGSISLLGQTLGAIHPALLAVTIAAVAGAAAMALYKSDSEKLTEALEKNKNALKSLAASTSEYAADAQKLIAIKKIKIKEDIRETEAQITLLKSGRQEISMLDRLQHAAEYTSPAFGKLRSEFKSISTESAEYQMKLAQLLSELDKLQRSLTDLNSESAAAAAASKKAQEEAAAATKKHNEQIAEQTRQLNERNKAILVDDRVRQEAAAQAATDRTMNAEARLAAMRTKLPFESTEQITAAFDEQRDREMAIFDERLQNANFFAGEQVAIEAERAVKMEELRQGEAAAIDRFNNRTVAGTKKVAKSQINIYAIASNAFQAALFSQAKGQRKFAVLAVELTGEVVKAELSIKAKQWAIEATALALTPGKQAEAAAKARAAAMAGAAVGVVGALTSVASSAISGSQDTGGFEDNSGFAKTAQQGHTQQLIARGPVNLTYVANQTIVGNVIPLDDVKEMFIEWNNEILRTAGMDAAAA